MRFHNKIFLIANNNSRNYYNHFQYSLHQYIEIRTFKTNKYTYKIFQFDVEKHFDERRKSIMIVK